MLRHTTDTTEMYPRAHSNTTGCVTMPRLVAPVLFALAISFVPPVAASSTPLNIKQLSLEQLMDIDVYSVSRRLEPYQGAPSAIHVLTAEEIRRARVTSVPEALRLVPGVQVARVDANKWAISIRGFNSRTSNKLLVLVDGRSIYDPLFSGVLWESRDVMLEDVERIEVIRGPGGTLWGANAVNGVINIVTKHARDSRGGIAAVGGGTEERLFGALRYGWQPGKNQHARVYAKAFERDTGHSSSGDAHDGTSLGQTGFRWDWKLNARDNVRVSGNYFEVTADERNSATTTQSVAHDGTNLMARWNRTLAGGGTLQTQFYYDRFNLDNEQLGEQRSTYDADFQHSFRFASQHQVVWGLGYRQTRDDLRDGSILKVEPNRRDAVTTGVFIQDTVGFLNDRWNVTLGTKFERNDYSGTEWQPNLRMAWTPDARRTAWASAARAVRVPSRLEADLVFGGQRLGDGFDAERLHAYELGYRELRNTDLWYDVTAFYNEYRNLLTIEQDFAFENRMHGHVYGVELAGRWKPAARIGLDASYSWLQMDLRVDSGSSNATRARNIEGSSPRQQFVLRSAFDFRRQFELDATLRFVDELSALDVPAYVELDLGFGWFPKPNVDVSLVGQNLLHEHHEEQPTTVANVTEVQRGVYLKTSWKF